MRNPPDRAVAVFRHQQRAVVCNGDTDRPSPHLGIVDHKPGDEILVLAGGDPVLETNANDLVARAPGSVPRAVLGGKAVADMVGGKCIAVVEYEAERSRMGLDQNVGSGNLPLQIGALAGVPWILVAADIEPGPTVECAVAHPGHIIRYQIVSHAVAFVGRAIDIASPGMNGEADAIA